MKTAFDIGHWVVFTDIVNNNSRLCCLA